MRKIRKSRSGVALVLVLGFLVLITIVSVGFLVSVSTEHSTATSAIAGSTGKQLADASVQLVMGQIRQATSLGPNIAWASQPGMIRTYGSGNAASSDPLAYYKLYSSDEMVIGAAAIGAFDLSNDVPANWNSLPALFTDLNAPVTSSTGALNYPIIDPRAEDLISGHPMVDGFSISNAPTSGSNNRAPMPIKWIYVLEDGTLTAPTGGTSTADFSGAPAGKIPTTENPIVGRIAFWTDDETCKLNINTAAGGSPWDQPMFNAGIEAAFSRYQPAAHEYTRFPGHPAATHMSPVMWSFSDMPSPHSSLASNPVLPSAGFSAWADWAPVLPAYARDYWQKALRLSPRNELGDVSSQGDPGSSQMGTVATAGASLPGSSTGVGLPTPVDSDRLYASVDELIFQPSRADRVGANEYEFQLTREELAKVRFFLTASSRAPEVNMFNQPKVAIWPVPDLDNKSVANTYSVAGDTRSAMDNLIAFCSTLNGQPYHFTRYNAKSTTADFVTSGSGRNQTLYDYLNGLLAKPVPGFGGTFTSRYGVAGASQILTQIYDYIRSCINLQDSSAGTESQPFTTRARRAYTTTPPNQNAPNQTKAGSIPGQGQVAPFLHPSNGTKGLGRFPTIKQATIMFIARGANQPPLQVVTSGPNAGRPLLFDAAGNSLLDASNNLTNAGLISVLNGNAEARMNDMHPFSEDPVINQLVVAGKPVLAVNATKLAANPNDPTAIYPVFSTTGAYPTLYSTNSNDAEARISVSPSDSDLKNFVHSGTTYEYYVSDMTGPAGEVIAATRPPQTHAGLNYLTLPRTSGSSTSGNMEGAYDLPNPRYQIATDGQQALQPYQTQVQAIFFVDPVNNAPGFSALHTDYGVNIQGLGGFLAETNPMNFTNDATETAQFQGGNAHVGGGSMYDIGALTHVGRRSNADVGNRALNFVSAPVVVGSTSLASQGATFSFTGAPLQIDLLAPTSPTTAETVQRYHIDFPSGTFPTPKLPFIPQWGSLAPNAPGAAGGGFDIYYSLLKHADNRATPDLNYPPKNVKDLTPSSVLTFTERGVSGGKDPLSSNPNFGVGGAALYEADPVSAGRNRTRIFFGSYQGPGMELVLPERDIQGGSTDYKYKLTADTVRSMECLYGDTRVIAALKEVPASFFEKHKFYDDTSMRSAHSIFAASKSGINADAGKGSLTALRGATTSYLTDIEPDLNMPKTSYVGYANEAGAYGYSTWGYPQSAPDKIRKLLGSPTRVGTNQWNPLGTFGYPHVTSSVDFTDTTFKNQIWVRGGDFDNGPNYNPDGPYISKAPETTAREDPNKQTINPDFNSGFIGNSAGDSLFSPNRQIASPISFGSLPAGFKTSFNPASPSPDDIDPWRTLLFSPNPNSTSHPSLSEVADAGDQPVSDSAPDYLMLDFFQMPVVDPYAIGEPFSTAGKINMNYQIAPFTYIKRDTALRGVLKSAMVAAVDDQFIGRYKGIGEGFNFRDNGPLDAIRLARGHWDFRYPVHAGETLKQFDKRFDAGDIFRSPAEICSLWLYPARQPTASNPDNPGTALVDWDTNSSNIKSWWYDGKGTDRKSLTGDNMRERPYDTIYPRLTTKSNSYTVHFLVQVLQKIPGTEVDEWVEERDVVVSEYRGSSLIERYIDPGDPDLPDFAEDPDATLDDYYKFRIVSTKKFTAE